MACGTLTDAHRNGGPRSVYALGRGDSVLVFASWVAGHPNDVTLLVPAHGVFVVFSVENGRWAAVVFIWEVMIKETSAHQICPRMDP